MKKIIIIVLVFFSCKRKHMDCDFTFIDDELYKQIKLNNVIRENVYQLDTISNEKKLSRITEFNSKGLPIIIMDISSDKVYKYVKQEYDENNYLKKVEFGENLDSLCLAFQYERIDKEQKFYYYNENGHIQNYEIFYNDHMGRDISKKTFDSDSILIEKVYYEWSYKKNHTIVKSIKIDTNDVILGTKVHKYFGCDLIESELKIDDELVELEKNKYNSSGLLEYSFFKDYRDSTKVEIFLQYSKNKLLEKIISITESPSYRSKEIEIFEHVMK